MRRFVRLAMLCAVFTLLSVSGLRAEDDCYDLKTRPVTYPPHPRDTDSVFVGYNRLFWIYPSVVSQSVRPGRIDITTKTEPYRPPPWDPPPCDSSDPSCHTTPPPMQPFCWTIGAQFPPLSAGNYDVYFDGNFLYSFTVTPTPAVPFHPAALALLAVALAAAGAVLGK